MRTSIWYRTEEQSPDKSGWYLGYRGFGGDMSNYDHANDYWYYDRKTDAWYTHQNRQYSAIIYYWTDADPDGWVDEDPPSIKIRPGYRARGTHSEIPAVQDAWAAVEEAIKRYETVKALVQ
jgi:hypothetical protein